MSNVETTPRASYCQVFIELAAPAGCQVFVIFLPSPLLRRFFGKPVETIVERKQQPLTIVRPMRVAIPICDAGERGDDIRRIHPRRVLKTSAIEALFDRTLVHRGIFQRSATIFIQSVRRRVLFHTGSSARLLPNRDDSSNLFSHERRESFTSAIVFE